MRNNSSAIALSFLDHLQIQSEITGYFGLNFNYAVRVKKYYFDVAFCLFSLR